MATDATAGAPPSPQPITAESDELQHQKQQQQQPLYSNSLSGLRNLSSALSVFLHRHDELQEHLDVIQTTIDSKLPQHLSTDPSPPQPLAIVPLSETLASATEETNVPDFVNSNQTEDNDRSRETEIESLFATMSIRGIRRYISSNLSKVAKLREEVPAAFKKARDPAYLALKSFGRFFLQGVKAYDKESPMIPARRVSLLILEFFLLMGCNDIKIEATITKEAQLAAVDWRKRLINEGGLAEASEIDGRGLLLLIGCFGIPKVFSNGDIIDLILSSNAREISDALRRSHVLLERIPAVIEKMMKNTKDFKAVDVVHIFGMESKFPPQSIVTSFVEKSTEIWNRARKAAHGSLASLKDANKRRLEDLKSLLRCLKEHKINPLEILPEFPINENIASLEREISDLKKKIGEQSILKRRLDEPKPPKRLMTPEVKRARLSEHGHRLRKDLDYVDRRMSSDRLTPIRLSDVAFPGHISNIYSTSSELHRPLPGIGGDVLVNRVGQVVPISGDPYGWHRDGALRERIIGHSYAEPSALGVNGLFRQTTSLEGFAGLPNPSAISAPSRTSSSDLYQFADAVAERELYGGSHAVPSVVPPRHSSYLY